MDVIAGGGIYPFPYPFPWPRSGGVGGCQDSIFVSKWTPWNYWFSVISHGTSLKNGGFRILPGRQQGKSQVTKNNVFAWGILEKLQLQTCIFSFFIFFEILKIELSPTRELQNGGFENCIGRLLLVPQICEFAVLHAWEPCFRDTHVQKTKRMFFSVFLEILVFPKFFDCFGLPWGGPGRRLDVLGVPKSKPNPNGPWGHLREPRGTQISSNYGNQRKSSSRVGKSLILAISTNFPCFIHFVQNLENWPLAYTRARFWVRFPSIVGLMM